MTIAISSQTWILDAVEVIIHTLNKFVFMISNVTNIRIIFFIIFVNKVTTMRLLLLKFSLCMLQALCSLKRY